MSHQLDGPVGQGDSLVLSFDDALDRLEVLGCGPRLAGVDHAYSRCPNHADRRPSLSIDVGDDGRLLLYCHAGCEFRDVLGALHGATPTGYRFDADRLARVKAKPALRFGLIAEYPYVATDSTRLCKRRGTWTDPATGEVVNPKAFLWSWWTGAGWSPGDGGRIPLLYRGDLIDKAATSGDTLYVVEGEKDADRLVSLGILATTPPHGAAKHWHDEWTRQLDGVPDLRVIADDDKPGRAHAVRVAALLHAARPERDVPIYLPADGCKDASEHLDAGNRLEALREFGDDGFVLAETITQQQLEWFWPGWVPDRHVTVCEGDGGIGKSTVWIDLIARCTTGQAMPDGGPTRHGAAIYITNEDDIATVVKGRLTIAGADMNQVLVLDPDRAEELSLPEDTDKLRRQTEAHGVVLIVIDPWTSFMSSKLSNNSDQEFRQAIGPAQLLAQQLDVAVVLMRHLRKGPATAREKGLGTVAVGNTARSVLLFTTDPDDETGAVIAQHKQNLSAPTTPLRYRIISSDPHDPASAYVEWRGASARTVGELTAVPEPDDQETRTQTEECAKWLKAFLSVKTPPEAARADIIKIARSDGLTWSEKVWRCARERLGIDATSRIKTERPGTIWRLPTRPKPVPPPQSGPANKHPRARLKGRTAPDQQTSDLQTPDETSPALPTHTGQDRAALPSDEPPTHCRTCHKPIMLRRPGRDQCERCRLDDREDETA